MHYMLIKKAVDYGVAMRCNTLLCKKTKARCCSLPHPMGQPGDLQVVTTTQIIC
jgi:hypothetical protein